jgi:fructose-1,6-bisphosphatase
LKTKNPFGKQQSDIDLKANDIVYRHLKLSGVVHAAVSEEGAEVSLPSTLTVCLENCPE